MFVGIVNKHHEMWRLRMADNQIMMLTGPDRIRKRPAVAFLSKGLDGAQYAVQTLLDIFLTKHSWAIANTL